MGKGQSKRSVDITTETTKEGIVVEEGAGKLGKIEDIDQLKPKLNGDSHQNDNDISPQQEAAVAVETAIEVTTNGHSDKVEEAVAAEAVTSDPKVVEQKNETIVKTTETVVVTTETIVEHAKAPIVEAVVEKNVQEVVEKKIEEVVETKVEEIKKEVEAEILAPIACEAEIEPETKSLAVEILEETKHIETTEAQKIEVKEDKEIQPEENVLPVLVEDVKKEVENGESTLPPPLPSIPPPSQVTVFAESAMSPENDITPISIPTESDLNKEIVEGKKELPVELLPETVAEITCEKILEHVQESAPPSNVEEVNNVTNVEELTKPITEPIVQATTETASAIAEIAEKDIVSIPPLPELESQINPETLSEMKKIIEDQNVESHEPKPEQIAETIALIEKVTEDALCSDDFNSINDSLPPPPPLDEELKDISVDISSPLPQNSLDSLPSPSSKSENSLPLPPTESINTTNDIAAAHVETTLTPEQSLESNELPPPVENKEETIESTIPKEEIVVTNGFNGDVSHEQPNLVDTTEDTKMMIQEQQQNVSDKIETKTEEIVTIITTVTTESSAVSINTEQDTIKSEESVPEKCPSPPASPTNAPEAVTAE